MIRHHALALALLVGMIFFIYWPILPLTKIATHTHYGDALINCYLINWFQYSLWTNPLGAFDAPLFYPQETSGAFSSINVFLSLITGPLQLFGNPVFCYNAALYVAIILSGVSMYGCTYGLFGNRKASLVAGVLFSCNADMLWHSLGHPNIVAPFFIPVLVYLAIHFFQRPTIAAGILFSVCLYGQFLVDPYLGFIGLIGLTPVMLLISALRVRTAPREVAVLYAAGLVMLGLVYVYTGPFREVSARLGNARSISEMIGNSAELVYGYLLPAFHERRNESFFGSLLGENTPYNRAVNSQYFGLSVYLTVVMYLAVMLLFSIRKRKLLFPSYTFFFLIVIVMGFLFSFGPYLWWRNEMTQWKLPMWYVYEYIPPLRFLREISRFAVLVVTGLGFFLALAISQWGWMNQGSKPLRMGILAIMLAVLAVEFRPIASPDFAYFDRRGYELIAKHPEIEIMGSIPPTSYPFLVQSTATFPKTPSGYWGGVYNHHYTMLEPVLADFGSMRSTALHGALGTQGLFVEGAEALALARSKPELQELSPEEGRPFGLFQLVPENINPTALTEAKALLESTPEFPPFGIVPDEELVKNPYSLPIELGGRQELYYNSIDLAANVGDTPLYGIPVQRINALMMRMSLTSLGVDYVDTKIYFRTDREPEFSEEKSITVLLPPDGKLYWAKFDFARHHERFADHQVIGVRFLFSANPFPGQKAVIESVYVDLKE
ncbi:MAG: hypothetical protein SFY68_14510 [Candidatus Sumerlaeia bacterium]|nr:hypothetical protein [Candidatus Sumerlaeia bacterium]